MSTDFATILDECLNRLKAGDSIPACLERYPEHAEELEPLLETVQLAASLRFTEPPRPQALARGRQRFLTEAARQREERRTTERSWLARVRDFFTAGTPGPVWGRAVAAIVVVLLLFGAVSGVVVQASESSLPGDPLYTVKQVTRQVQLVTTWNPRVREEKEKQIQAKEREEVRQATEQGRIFEEDVAGIIVGWDGSILVLEGDLHIQVIDTTQVPDQPIVGHIALVHVRSQNGRLLAEQVEVQPQAQVMVAPTETATWTAVPTATLEPTATPRPTNTPEPTRQPTKKKVVPTRTPTPKPKVTDTPFPTATAVLGPSIHIFELRGTIESISESMWVVAGEQVRITSDTVIKGEPAVGRIAHVRANRLNDGTFEAIEVEIETPNTPTPAKVTITGMVESKHSDTIWYIGGRRVRKDDRTKIEGELRIGAFAEVEGVQESPTTVFAHRITVIRACEHPTPFEGVILAIDADSGTWTVQVVVNRDGQDVQDQYTVVVDSDTQVQGTPAIGLVVQVEACWTGGNTYVAQRIFVVPTPTPTDTPAATPTPELPSLQSTPTLGLGATVTPSPEAHETQQTPTVEPSPVTTSTPVLNDATATATP